MVAVGQQMYKPAWQCHCRSAQRALTEPLWFHLMLLGRMPVSMHTASSSMSCRISCMRPLSRQMASTGQLGSAKPQLPSYHSMPTTRQCPAQQAWCASGRRQSLQAILQCVALLLYCSMGTAIQ